MMIEFFSQHICKAEKELPSNTKDVGGACDCKIEDSNILLGPQSNFYLNYDRASISTVTVNFGSPRLTCCFFDLYKEVLDEDGKRISRKKCEPDDSSSFSKGHNDRSFKCGILNSKFVTENTANSIP